MWQTQTLIVLAKHFTIVHDNLSLYMSVHTVGFSSARRLPSCMSSSAWHTVLPRASKHSVRVWWKNKWASWVSVDPRILVPRPIPWAFTCPLRVLAEDTCDSFWGLLTLEEHWLQEQGRLEVPRVNAPKAAHDEGCMGSWWINSSVSGRNNWGLSTIFFSLLEDSDNRLDSTRCMERKWRNETLSFCAF